MKLCFLHGLDSSPQGTKASFLRAYDSRCLIPNLPPNINERLKVLKHELRAPVLLVGSSPALKSEYFSRYNSAKILPFFTIN